MPSAKIVAQNPGGSFNPLSSLGQAGLSAATFEEAATVLIFENAASTTATKTRTLNEPGNRIELSLNFEKRNEGLLILKKWYSVIGKCVGLLRYASENSIHIVNPYPLMRRFSQCDA
jgi:hypothetical protein